MTRDGGEPVEHPNTDEPAGPPGANERHPTGERADGEPGEQAGAAEQPPTGEQPDGEPDDGGEAGERVAAAEQPPTGEQPDGEPGEPDGDDDDEAGDDEEGGAARAGGGGERTINERIYTGFETALERLPGALGERAREASGGRFGIGSQVVVGLGGGVTLTLGAIFLVLLLIGVVQRGQRALTEEQMPELVEAFRLFELSETLVRASPELMAASTPAELEAVRSGITTEGDSLNVLVERLGLRTDDGERDVGSLAEDLVASLDGIYESVGSRMSARERLGELELELEAAGRQLQSQLEQEVDDQYFFIHTGLRELSDSPVPQLQRRALPEISHYSGLLNFRASQNEASTLIQQALTETAAELLLVNRERVETALSDVREALDEIRPPTRDSLARQIDALGELYGGPGGIFLTRQAELEESRRAEDLLAGNRTTTTLLVQNVEDLVDGIQVEAAQAARRSSFLSQLGFWFLLGVAVVTLAAARMAWKLFGQPLITRLGQLFEATRRMSEGDLEVEVAVEGNDEVTDMAGALEVFRQHALEIQRLNLVEQLAEEVQAKNEALEQTLEDLRRTQQQVVTQEKLASLGTLTAGIAHEIRNPLNFVNNFSVLSQELVEELREELGGSEDGKGELDREFVAEVLQDLNLNLTKVRDHGSRADRIVEGMLAHSRDDSAGVETINVNQMLDEYAKLAYHGLRGTDSSFNVTLLRKFDEKAGDVTGIARDLSRVFLNVVTNACHATAARREQGGESDYSPTVTLSTKGHDDRVVVGVRDNGTGIPDEIVQKIFEPFFTTKTGTQGTGLGLSISRDIIVGHGGELEVETEPGEFTEFRITLLRETQMADAAADS